MEKKKERRRRRKEVIRDQCSHDRPAKEVSFQKKTQRCDLTSDKMSSCNCEILAYLPRRYTRVRSV